MTNRRKNFSGNASKRVASAQILELQSLDKLGPSAASKQKSALVLI